MSNIETTPVPIPHLDRERERRHLELLAATLHNSVSRTMDELLKGGGPLPDDDEWVVKEAVMTARAIQAEVRRTEGGDDA
jgi:hypothetical protein